LYSVRTICRDRTPVKTFLGEDVVFFAEFLRKGSKPYLKSPRGTAMHGAKLQLMPVARTSSAVMRAAFSTSSGFRVQAKPMLCGKITASNTLLCPR